MFKNLFSSFLVLLLITISTNTLFAHDLNYANSIPHHWTIGDQKSSLDGSFYFLKNGYVKIELNNNQFTDIKFESLSDADKQYVLNRQAKIDALNQQIIANQNSGSKASTANRIPATKIYILLAIITLLGLITYKFRSTKNAKYLVPVFSTALLFSIVSFSLKSMQASNPSTINNAFAPFVPNIHTFYDSTYFWVESKGIPTTHPMMVGISSSGWQRQVPIPQCYMGTNAWPIPLNPVMASSPIPVDSIHFTRGAIAIAVNGVPIFNEHTNTGADALTAGQLDTYGGHCGRGDDYHYHIAPLHLYNHTDATLPIAYALDGFAVYGAKEADGSNMQSLDANHGHAYGGTYHYHGTSTYPYMIAKMAGQVTEDATHQLIPQAVAHPVRAGQLPLNGALITACIPNATNNGYNLTYTYKNNTDSVVYSWDANGNYTFNYYTGATMDSTETKHGFVQCVVPATPTGTQNSLKQESMTLFPNPTSEEINIKSNKGIRSVQIYAINGDLLLTENKSVNSLGVYSVSVKELKAGIYLIRTIDIDNAVAIKKFVKE